MRLENHDGYYFCEGNDCDFKSKKTSKLVYFKGRHLCFRCKNKASQCLNNIPTSNPSLSTLRRITRLPEGRNMPKDNWKGMIKVSPELKTWAETRSNGPVNKEKVIWVGLSWQENQLLYRHLHSLGYSHEEILVKIDEVKSQIKKAHEEYKNNLRTTVPTFQEEFNKLVGVSA